MKIITLNSTTLYDAVYSYLENNFDYKEITLDRVDEFYNTVEIAGLKFNPSTVISECDPIAFDMLVDEEIAQDTQEIVDSLLENGEAEINDYNIKLVNNVLEIESVVKC